MTVRRLLGQLLLRPDDVSPSRDDFEVVGVFNPGAICIHGEVVLLVRVAERPREKRPGFTGLPRWIGTGELTVDWVSDDQLDRIDARVVKHKVDGRVRLTFTSHLRIVHCGNGRAVQEISGTRFLPDGELEEYGIEDPRITPLQGRLYVTYVAVSRHGPATGLASTADFRTFERHGIIFCPENKDVVLFPELINGTFAALHRPVCGTAFTRPEMWVARSPDLIHWGGHAPLRISASKWQSGRVGGGAPPIRVPEGWLVVYHGNRRPKGFGDVGTYYGGALLLDSEDVTRIRRRLIDPFLTPEEAFETTGFVPSVVFPTGIVTDGESLIVYYGAADTCVAFAEFSTRDLLDAMTQVDVTM